MRDTVSTPLVSVIIPTMNEAGSIGEVIDEIKAAFKDRQTCEIIVVDTNSTDGTVKVAERRGARVVREGRRGYGRAYMTGFAKARGEFIATLDGDLTYPASDIPSLVKMLGKKRLDFITCDRLTRLRPGVMTRSHRIGNWVLSTALRLLFRARIHDSQSGMWVFRKRALKRLRLTSTGMAFSEELKIEAWRRGLRVSEVRIDYRPRVGEVKLSSWKDGGRNLAFLFRKRFG